MKNFHKMLVLLFAGVFLVTGAPLLAEKLSRTTLKVSNLYCGSCLSHIDTRLKEIPEVTGMTGDLRQGSVTINHKPSIEGSKLAGIITQLGYPAEVVSEAQVEDKDSFTSSRQPSSGNSCCGGETGTYRGCGASAESWKQLFKKSN